MTSVNAASNGTEPSIFDLPLSQHATTVGNHAKSQSIAAAPFPATGDEYRELILLESHCMRTFFI